jgi:hypothetical protein
MAAMAENRVGGVTSSLSSIAWAWIRAWVREHHASWYATSQQQHSIARFAPQDDVVVDESTGAFLPARGPQKRGLRSAGRTSSAAGGDIVRPKQCLVDGEERGSDPWRTPSASMIGIGGKACASDCLDPRQAREVAPDPCNEQQGHRQKQHHVCLLSALIRHGPN